MGLGTYGGALYNQNARGRAFSGNSGDKGNQEARKYIADQFSNAGLQAALQGRYYNVVAELTGALHPDNVLLLAAHYDTRKSNTPGGDGDASGVAGVLEAARVLSQYQFDNTIRFVVFNGSEKAFRGSNDYALKILGFGKDKLLGVIDLNQILHPAHDKNAQLPKALALGLGTQESAALDWAAAFAAAAQQFVPALPLDSAGPYVDVASDHYSFVLNGYIQALRLSENSSKDHANSSIGTVADASDGPAGVAYDDAFAANVVRASVALLAQQAGYEGPAAAVASDSDGDGFSDEIETALGSDPNSASSTPLGLPPATPAGALDTIGMTVGLDFVNTASDTLAATGVLPLHAGFAPKGAIVIVDMGGVVKSLTLAAGGTGTKGNNTFVLKAKLKNGVVATDQLAQFSLTLGQGNFKKQLAKFDVLNATHSQKPVTVPLTIIFNNEVRSSARVLLYTATLNISGAAR